MYEGALPVYEITAPDGVGRGMPKSTPVCPTQQHNMTETKGEDEIFPEDSVSNISFNTRKTGNKQPGSDASHGSNSRYSRTSKSSSLQSAMVKEIKLAAERELVQRSIEIKQKKRLLLIRLDEAAAQQEIRKAEERANHLRFEREIQEEEAKLQDLELQMKIDTEYEAARATINVLKEWELGSSVASSAKVDRHGKRSDITTSKTKKPVVKPEVMKGNHEHEVTKDVDEFYYKVMKDVGQYDAMKGNSQHVAMQDKNQYEATERPVVEPKPEPKPEITRKKAVTQNYHEHEVSMQGQRYEQMRDTAQTDNFYYNGATNDVSQSDTMERALDMQYHTPKQEVVRKAVVNKDDCEYEMRKYGQKYEGTKHADDFNYRQMNGHVDQYNTMTPNNYHDCRMNPEKEAPPQLPQEHKEDSTLAEILKQLIGHQKEHALPSAELETFNGTDVSAFPAFKRNFRYVVENNTQDPVRRLEMLLKFTTGDANDLIKQCAMIEPPEAGYMRATYLLDRDYGQTAVMAAVYINKAESWPRVPNGDKEALRKFSIFLTNCCGARMNNPDLASMDGYDFLKKIASKLPTPLQQQWIKVVGRLRERSLSATIHDFDKFVGQISRDENDPRIAGLGYQARRENLQQTRQRGSSSATKTAFATAVHTNGSTYQPKKGSTHSYQPKKGGTDSQQPKKPGVDDQQLKNKAATHPCLYCGDNTQHALQECRKFGALTANEKSDHCFKKGLCFGCVNPGHIKKNCPNSQWSKCKRCKKNHATVLHDPEREKKSQAQQPQSQAEIRNGCVNTRDKSCKSPMMAIVPVLVKAKAGHRTVATYAFVDNGCGAVFTSPELSNHLKLRTRKTRLMLKTLNLTETTSAEVLQDEIQIGDLQEKSFIDIQADVYVKGDFPVDDKDVPKQEDVNRWEHLRSIKVPDFKNSHYPVIPKVTVMIGSNIPAATQPLETRTGQLGQPYAIRSPLGWIVYGILSKNTEDAVQVNFSKVTNITTIKKVTDNLEELFKEYTNREFEESQRLGERGLSVEDKEFMKIMDDTTVKEDGHYKTALPFKDREVEVPCNRMQVMAYAQRLKNKLQKDPKLHQQYTTFMSELEEKKYAEKVPETELERSDGRVWHIPHHNVHHPHKPDKVRVVFNCPISYKGFSLNEQLFQGPDLTNRLYGVLLRWRQQPVAMMADIEAMFYQVRVNRNDCDMLRYIWWPDGDLSNDPEEYRMLVHLFGAVSSPTCANYALKKTATDNGHKYSKEVTDAVNNHFYVDDFLKSVATEEEGIELAHSITELLSEGGFNLTKWISNSRKLLESIPVEARAKEVKKLDVSYDSLPVERALGVQWCVESDQLQFCMKEMNRLATRRNILSVMSSIYDPFGVTSPFVLKAKMILQELCREKIGWDEPIPEDQQKKWNAWLNDLPKLENVKLNRCFKPPSFGQVVKTQLHHFADASSEGYGTVSYLRFVNDKGQIHSEFVTGKARVAPLKSQTIVRMELTAAASAVKIDSMIKREIDMNIDQTTFWTDSQTVLKYLANERSRYEVFVANRVSLIRSESDVKQWKYIPTSLNPADHASRGLTADQLISKEEWLKGPEFLSQAETEWPDFEVNSTKRKEVEDLVNENSAQVTEVNASMVQSEEQTAATSKLLEYHSDWKKLQRAVAWWHKYGQYLLQKSRQNSQKCSVEVNKTLTLEEIESAENAILRYVQAQEFASEMNALNTKQKTSEDGQQHSQCTIDQKKTKTFLSRGSPLANLDPELTDDMLRVGGRLRNAKIPQNAKHQVILPKDNHVSTLIIRHVHRSVNHQGHNHVLAELRQKYWILKARVAVKSIIHKCVICKKYQARTRNQKMADLPADRVQPDAPAFYKTGVDYFGPFETKHGRSYKKRYGVIFTCMNSRAVHIEVADSLDTSSCIDAMRRFTARRGSAHDLYSDNGTNFVGANNELRGALKDLDQELIQRYTTSHGIRWHFNPPAASHFGGVWERQIRTIRKVLTAILNEQNMKTTGSDEQLRTLMCEVESTINSRPLTRMSDDPNDLDVITPQNLLLLHPSSNMPPGIFEQKDVYARRRWRQMQFLADLFWKRWIKEYLPELQRRQRWLRPEKNVQIGDVVLVIDDKAPRNSWPMGLIQETHMDKHGLVRSVKVKTKTAILTRPITKLCLILEQED